MIRLAPVFPLNCPAHAHTRRSSPSARPRHHNGPPASYISASACVWSFGRPAYGLGGDGGFRGGVSALKRREWPRAFMAEGKGVRGAYEGRREPCEKA